MANIKIFSPKLEAHTLAVTIPLEAPIIIIRNQSISNAEESFASRTGNESNPTRKSEFDRARLLLKWASCCNASLVEMHNADHELEITLSFKTFDSMVEFRNALSVNVTGANVK